MGELLDDPVILDIDRENRTIKPKGLYEPFPDVIDDEFYNEALLLPKPTYARLRALLVAAVDATRVVPDEPGTEYHLNIIGATLNDILDEALGGDRDHLNRFAHEDADSED